MGKTMVDNKIETMDCIIKDIENIENAIETLETQLDIIKMVCEQHEINAIRITIGLMKTRLDELIEEVQFITFELDNGVWDDHPSDHEDADNPVRDFYKGRQD